MHYNHIDSQCLSSFSETKQGAKCSQEQRLKCLNHIFSNLSFHAKKSDFLYGREYYYNITGKVHTLHTAFLEVLFCIELKVETLISVYVREKAQQMSQVTDYTTLYKDKIRFSS